MCRLKKPEESFEYPLESIRALLDSWKNGRGVRQSTQVREPQTLQRFCQISSAHIWRRQGDSEDVRKWWGGQWVCREGLSQGRGNDQFVDETAQVTRCMDLELAPRPFMWMDVPSNLLVQSPSIWYFYVLKFIFWLPKQRLSWLRNSILQRDAIWILNLPLGLEGLALKDVGRSLDTINFFMTILPQCPFFRERRPTLGRIIYTSGST